MKVQIKIPTGWRKLKKGESLKVGDRFFSQASDFNWYPIVSQHLPCTIQGFSFIYIRRVSPKPKTLKTVNGVKIPKGYYQLKKGKRIKQGDMFYRSDRGWCLSNNWISGHYIGDTNSTFEYIRPLKNV